MFVSHQGVMSFFGEQQQYSGTVQWRNREPSVTVVQYSTAALAVQYCTAGSIVGGGVYSGQR